MFGLRPWFFTDANNTPSSNSNGIMLAAVPVIKSSIHPTRVQSWCTLHPPRRDQPVMAGSSLQRMDLTDNGEVKNLGPTEADTPLLSRILSPASTSFVAKSLPSMRVIVSMGHNSI